MLSPTASDHTARWVDIVALKVNNIEMKPSAVFLLLLQSRLVLTRCVSSFIATALVSNASFPNPWVECWRFDRPMLVYPTVGAAMKIADTNNVTYVVLPPRSEEGIHKPPHPMLVTTQCVISATC